MNMNIDQVHVKLVIVQFAGAIELTLIILSIWVLLGSFEEANWWHFLDPMTTGISFRAIYLLLASVLLPPILLGFKLIRCYKLPWYFLLFAKLIPSILLCVVAHPGLRNDAWKRSLLLGSGVGLIPLFVAWILTEIPNGFTVSMPNTLRLDEKPSTSKTESNIETHLSEYQSTSNENFKTFQTNDFILDAACLVAILLNMSVRFCTGSVNVFAENSLFSFMLLLVTGAFLVINTTYKMDKLTLKVNEQTTPGDEKATPDDEQATSDDEQATPDGEQANPDDEQISQLNDVEHADQYLEKKKEKKGYNILEKSLEKKASKRFRLFNADQDESVFVFSCIQGFTVGLMAVMFLMFLSTPYILQTWTKKRLNETAYGSLILLAFTSGIIFTLFVPPKTNLIDSDQKLSFDVVCINVGLLGAFVLGYALLIGRSKSNFLGALLMTFAMPYIFSIILTSVRWLVIISNSRKKNTNLQLLPGLIAFFVGVGFIASHIVIISFTNPYVTKFFLGRMGIVSVYFVLFITFSIGGVSVVFNLYQKSYIANPNPAESVLLQTDTDFSDVKVISFFLTYRHIIVFGMLSLSICLLSLVIGPHFSNNNCVSHKGETIADVKRAIRNFAKVSEDVSLITVFSWNVLFCKDLSGKDTLPCVREIITALQPHIVGLQETEALFPYFGGKDIPRYIAKYNNYRYYPALDPSYGIIGTTIISRIRPLTYTSYVLPPDKDRFLPRYSAIRMEFFINSRRVEVFNIHAVYKNWTLGEDGPSPLAYLSRDHISFIIQRTTNDTTINSTIIMGDFNLNPYEPELKLLADQGFKRATNPKQLLTPTNVDKTTIDHIFYRGITLIEFKIFSETSDISDHKPVAAVFKISKP